MLLVTGGAGFIASHTIISLLENGYEVVAVDNFTNSNRSCIKRIEEITKKKIYFIQGDIRDKSVLDMVFSKYSIESVLHFAGLKAVGESIKYPLNYYDNNVNGSLNLFKTMAEHGVFRVIFSSSATVYGPPTELPITEAHPTTVPQNPYGRSKLIVEQMLQDMAVSGDHWSIALLRYFNPIGAHESGLLGEAPNGVPNNLLPYLSQVAIGKLKQLSVFGNNYPTHDGTCIRDYIHVVDLAQAHAKALKYLENNTGIHTWNLGTGIGYSVMQIINAFEKATGISIPYQVVDRRPGDISECWACPSKAEKELGWKAKHDLHTMVTDTWRWQKNNPNGY